MSTRPDAEFPTSLRPTRFTLRQLQYFVAAVEAGSLSGAAQALQVSQPALSQAITDLERALGVQLCIRRKAHGVTLTRSGREVLRQTRQLLRDAHDLDRAVSDERMLTGVLAVGCYVTLAPTMLPPLLQGFSALHPQLRLEFVEDTQDVLTRRLISGELDVAVLYDMELHPDLSFEVLHRVRPHVLLAAEHPLARRRSIRLRELADQPMVLLDAPPSSAHALSTCRSAGLDPHVRFRPKSYELARALVGRGMGWAMLVQRPAHETTYEGTRVVIKEISDPVPAAAVVLAWSRDVRLNRQTTAFREHCRLGVPPSSRRSPGPRQPRPPRPTATAGTCRP